MVPDQECFQYECMFELVAHVETNDEALGKGIFCFLARFHGGEAEGRMNEGIDCCVGDVVPGRREDGRKWRRGKRVSER